MGGSGARAGDGPQRPDRDPDGRACRARARRPPAPSSPSTSASRTRTSRSPPATSTGPAAVEQLVTMGRRAGAHVYEQGTERRPGRDRRLGARAGPRGAPRRADRRHRRPPPHRPGPDGRAVADPQEGRSPHDVLLVVDAMTGQDAVGVAESFAEVAEFDGVVMTKLDGDARGGAALCVKAVTGKPILFASTGEKIEDFDKFHPDRMASGSSAWATSSRLIEKAEAAGRREGGRRAAGKTAKRTSSRSRTSSPRCARSAKWARSAASSGCCPGWGR